MAFGAALMFIGMLLTLMSPLTAEKDRFGEIECTKLTVVNAVDTPLVILDAGTISEHGGLVAVSDNVETRVRLSVGEHGGAVDAFGKDGKSAATFTISEHGGLVAVYGKDGYSGAGASLIISEHGGEAFTMDKYGEGKLLD